eukprot:227085-Pelagomonas_calceolata.AAC.2
MTAWHVTLIQFYARKPNISQISYYDRAEADTACKPERICQNCPNTVNGSPGNPCEIKCRLVCKSMLIAA